MTDEIAANDARVLSESMLKLSEAGGLEIGEMFDAPPARSIAGLQRADPVNFSDGDSWAVSSAQEAIGWTTIAALDHVRGCALLVKAGLSLRLKAAEHPPSTKAMHPDATTAGIKCLIEGAAVFSRFSLGSVKYVPPDESIDWSIAGSVAE